MKRLDPIDAHLIELRDGTWTTRPVVGRLKHGDGTDPLIVGMVEVAPWDFTENAWVADEIAKSRNKRGARAGWDS